MNEKVDLIEQQDLDPDSKEKQSISSPRWNATTKLVVALTFVALVATLIASFRSLIGPLLLAFIMVYLLHPVANFLHLKFKISWKFSVNLIYFVVIIIVVGFLTTAGIIIVNQVQSLINFLQRSFNQLPEYLNGLSAQTFRLGPFSYDLHNLDLTNFGQQLLSAVQPLFGQVGSFVGTFASGAFSTLGWVAFIVVISYFVLLETTSTRDSLLTLEIPGYQVEMSRLGKELGRIWNSFLRGQLIVMAVTTLIYTAILGTLGVHYFYGLALLAGLARLIPYIGPAVTWTVYFLVTYFQGTTILGLEPIWYAVLVVGIGLVLDSILDNLVVPQVLSESLKVHPAAVMIAALVGAIWLGLIGILLAAPVLASIKLFSNYALQKLFDKNPWSPIPTPSPPKRAPSIKIHFQKFLDRIRPEMHTEKEPDKNKPKKEKLT
jgi:predicted PurR-regulated permease PerM